METNLKRNVEISHFNRAGYIFNKVKFNEETDNSTKGRIIVRYCNKQGTCIAQLP